MCIRDSNSRRKKQTLSVHCVHLHVKPDPLVFERTGFCVVCGLRYYHHQQRQWWITAAHFSAACTGCFISLWSCHKISRLCSLKASNGRRYRETRGKACYLLFRTEFSVWLSACLSLSVSLSLCVCVGGVSLCVSVCLSLSFSLSVCLSLDWT